VTIECSVSHVPPFTQDVARDESFDESPSFLHTIRREITQSRCRIHSPISIASGRSVPVFWQHRQQMTRFRHLFVEVRI
jgi:hypothetical protein